MNTFRPKTIITNDQIPKMDQYSGLKVVDCYNDPNARQNYEQHLYQFQDSPTGFTPIRSTLTRKGSNEIYRLVAFCHITMQQFIDIVKYDPSNPNTTGFDSAEMKKAHEQTQSDFKGQKMKNMIDFKNYIKEGMEGYRPLYLPTVCGWQSEKYFNETIFVCLDGSDPNALYGYLYLPKRAVMQADGQTQTAAIFRAADTKEARETDALNNLTLTLEIELNMNEEMAGNSFADRNGRGSKKNLNLVKKLDTSSPLSKLNIESIKGTVFENRLADGRTTGTSITATANVVDLNTMSLMLMEAISGGRLHPNDLKHWHIPYFKIYAKEYLEILDEAFAHEWKDPSPKNEDTYRRLYVHGWPFALKALGKVYFNTQIDKLNPIVKAVLEEKTTKNELLSDEENFKILVTDFINEENKTPKISLSEMMHRLDKIDWTRYRKHWIAITGYSMKDGKKRTFPVKSTGELQVVALAQNNANFINAVANKILSNSWVELCSDENEPIN
ncbi:hypothetical protein [Bacillus infantis]|uniref:hypothetical protein n=1 Tax=Bacillus infantis TaxID=324767 RepID=UPI003CF38ECD